MIKDEPAPNKLSKQERRKQKVAARAAQQSIEAIETSIAQPEATKPVLEKVESIPEVKGTTPPVGDSKPSKQERRKQKVALKTKDTNSEAKTPVNEANIVVVQATQQNATQKEEKSKAELRAERRAKQEQQRLAKENTKKAENVAKPPPNVPQVKKTESTYRKTTSKRDTFKKLADTAHRQNKIQLFRHLEIKHMNLQCVYSDIHPSIIKLGAQYASMTIIGSDARCLALLQVLKHLISDFQTPANQELCRAFESHLNHNVEHLQSCRPFAVSMTNALKHFKLNLMQIKTSHTDAEKTEKMTSVIDGYVEDEMQKAAVAISQKVCEKIKNDDVILTYGHSSLVNKILIDAKREGKEFKVIVVDARPLLEGRQTLTKLINAGIECTYILIKAVNFIIKQATKVLLGAHALLNNGYVMSRAGSALVALIAKRHMKPVMVCCETFKFSERTRTDSFVYNEIGDPDAVMPIKEKSGYLNALNLMYDVTPPDYITGVATELGILPCTSVPVILRLKASESPC